MTLTQLVELAHKSVFVCHPQAIVIARTDSGKWAARIGKDSSEATRFYGDTPEEALKELGDKIVQHARDRVARAERDLAEAKAALQGIAPNA